MLLAKIEEEQRKGAVMAISLREIEETPKLLPLRSHTFRVVSEMYGGDDGARTRDLCRDRAAL